MEKISPKRQLAAIMFTDIVGYTALMGKDQARALDLVRISKDIQKPLVEKHHGTWLKEMGDGAMAQFSTALDAVHCAVEIQEMARAKLDGKLRIGIHLGDITIENEDVYGDGVNVASRLESVSDPGGIYISDSIEKAVRGQLTIQAKYLGELQLKNVDYGVRTYALQGVGLPVPDIKAQELKGHFVAEMQRRGVLRTGFVYVAIGVIITLFWNQAQSFGIQLPSVPTQTIIYLLLGGFIVAMYLAWTYERSPDGFVRTSSKQSWRNPYSVSQRKPLTSNGMIVILLVAIVSLLLLPKFTAKTTEKNPDMDMGLLGFHLGEQSVAVLPFENLSSDPEQEYFSDGMTDDVLNYLSKISGLRVKSRTSTLQYKDTNKTIPEIGLELGVAYILEGTIRKSGNKVRIVAQLIEVRTDEHLWSETFDRDLTEIFAIQSEVAQKIAVALEVQLTDSEKEALAQKESDIIAYDYLLQAREAMKAGYGEVLANNLYYYEYDRSSYLKASILLNKAIEIEPDFAPAYLEMAKLQTGAFNRVSIDSALKTVNKLIELDPSIAEAFLIRSRLKQNATIGDYDGAEQDLSRAVSIAPNDPNVMLLQAIDYFNQGDYDRSAEYAIKSTEYAYARTDPNFLVRWGRIYRIAGNFSVAGELFEEAYKLDPTSANALYALEGHSLYEGRPSQMLKYAKERSLLWNNSVLVDDNLAWANYLSGNYEEAEVRWANIGRAGSLHSRHRLAMVKWEKGEIEEAKKILHEKMRDDSTHVLNDPGKNQTGRYYDLAICNAFLGNIEDAYTWLERAMVDDTFISGIGIWWIENDPMLDNLRGEPRFESIKMAFNAKNQEISAAYQKKLNELEASEDLKNILR